MYKGGWVWKEVRVDFLMLPSFALQISLLCDSEVHRMSTESGKGWEEAEMDKEVKRESDESGTKGNGSWRNEKILNLKVQKFCKKKNVLVKAFTQKVNSSSHCTLTEICCVVYVTHILSQSKISRLWTLLIKYHAIKTYGRPRHQVRTTGKFHTPAALPQGKEHPVPTG